METIENDGFIIIKNFFEKEKINDLLESSKQIFQTQFDYLNYDSDFKSNMIKLFNEHFDTFSNCGKMIQGGLIELYRLALDPSLINKIIELGVENPNMCTRPVLFFNHEKLAKEVPLIIPAKRVPSGNPPKLPESVPYLLRKRNVANPASSTKLIVSACFDIGPFPTVFAPVNMAKRLVVPLI